MRSVYSLYSFAFKAALAAVVLALCAVGNAQAGFVASEDSLGTGCASSSATATTAATIEAAVPADLSVELDRFWAVYRQARLIQVGSGNNGQPHGMNSGSNRSSGPDGNSTLLHSHLTLVSGDAVRSWISMTAVALYTPPPLDGLLRPPQA